MAVAVAAPRLKRRLSLLAAAAFLATAVWCGCASTVTPPRDPPAPVTIHLLSTGRHAGLLLPCGDGRIVEYGYGHWTWYALAKTNWWRAPGAVLWPSQGTLGRRYLRENDLETMHGKYGGGSLADFEVATADANGLLVRLDAQFAAGGTPHHQPLYDMDFVKHEDDFWMFHDCHDEVAEWLRVLGCEVERVPVRTGLRLAEKAP